MASNSRTVTPTDKDTPHDEDNLQSRYGRAPRHSRFGAQQSSVVDGDEARETAASTATRQ
jgi:hypothetical protein